MAYGIDPRLPDSINQWNSPEHWLRSDIQSASDRGQMDKVKALTDALKATLAPGIQAGADQASVDAAKARVAPEMGLVDLKEKLNPSGTEALLAAAGLGQPAPALGSRLSKGWSLGPKGEIIEEDDQKI